MKKNINREKIDEFKSMRESLSLQDAIKEANRCLLCYDAPCSEGCPAGTDPGKFIRQIKFYNYKGAARTIRNNNPMGSVCAFVCPVEKLCEQKCSVKALEDPINISGLQRFASEYGEQQGLEAIGKSQKTEGKVAIIGGGPAGIGCASTLAKLNYDVTIFEKEESAGGVPKWNIPAFRLPDEAIDRDLKNLTDQGVEIRYNSEIDSKDAVTDFLNDGFKAVFISTGLNAPFELELLDDYSNVTEYISFLRQFKSGDEENLLEGKNIAIIGGGSVAIDSAITAKANGAGRVYLISLEHLNELPADKEEIELARTMDIIFKAGSQVTGVVAEDDSLSVLKGVEIDWIEAGKFVPENAKQIAGTEFNVNIDLVVQAIGTKPGEEVARFAKEIETKGKGIVVVNDNFETNIPGVFAGGDVVNGGASVVQAVAEGKKAAEKIDGFMRGNVETHGLASVTIPSNNITPIPNLNINFCGVEFENPFCLSSSPVGNHAEMCARAFDAGWGGIVYKTLGLEKSFKIVMPSPRLSVYNYMDKRFVGLQNAEQITDRPIAENIKDIAWLKKNYPKKILISSIMGYTDEDWAELAKMSEDAGADMLELNFSCPQMARKDAGHRVGQDFHAVAGFTEVVKKACKLPVIAKMTPNITDMIPVALAAKEGGADAISAINTIKAITDIDIENFTPLPNIYGHSAATGFSGPSVKPVALRFVSDLYNSKPLGLPISGIGGIETWKDALHFLLLGATNLQVTTGILRYGYRIVEDMIEGLTDFMIGHNISSLDEIIGKAAEKIIDPSDFNTRYQVVSIIDQEKCIGCGQCYISCHDGANQAIVFDAEKRKAGVDEERCVGCLLCKHVCPVWDCVSYKQVDTLETKHAAVF
jgi:dihydropyrimidine dehydrogenase (NAD+) subunit PreA